MFVVNKTITINQILYYSNITKNSCINHNNNSLDINYYIDFSMYIRPSD